MFEIYYVRNNIVPYNLIVPTSGCDAISSGGTCYSHFTSTAGIDWEDARLQCVSQGYDIATITSSEDNLLVYNIPTSVYCWIGINDINTEGTYVWADGSSNSYRNWDANEPNNGGGGQDCGVMWTQGYWDDDTCARQLGCYFCSSDGKNL